MIKDGTKIKRFSKDDEDKVKKEYKPYVDDSGIWIPSFISNPYDKACSIIYLLISNEVLDEYLDKREARRSEK